MQNLLQDLIIGNLFAFLLLFMRFGMAFMLMPGIGDSFVSPTVRLLYALAFCFVLTPVLSSNLPPMPAQTSSLIMLLLSEAFIGIFIGTVMRLLVASLDIAATIISAQVGFSNAMLFNPMTGGQGTVISAVYSSLGVTLMLVTNLHHMMLATMVDSYTMYPVTGSFPDTGTIAETIGRVVTIAFKIGVQITIPFLIVGILIQLVFGLTGRLMPQIQVFFLTLPIQIFVNLLLIAMTISVTMMYWLSGYDTMLIHILTPE